MHIRPYVDMPEAVEEGWTGPDLEPFARCGTGETAELPALLPPERPDARLAGAGGPSASRGGSHRRGKGRPEREGRGGRGG
ncbi:MAG: hypothetical protein ACRDP3_06215, partial [Streptomyces sp.]|uniref:hypothetical protein n=1 Tax=Streptomyces sp. TaxID=1931 RepID=UPI003D6BCCEF